MTFTLSVRFALCNDLNQDEKPRNKFQGYKLKQAKASYVCSPLQRGLASSRAIYRSVV